MPTPHERAIEIVNLLTATLPEVLQDGVQLALRQSLQTAGLVNELEALGYQLKSDITYTLQAVPVEIIFDQSLTENDRSFLRGLGDPPGI